VYNLIELLVHSGLVPTLVILRSSSRLNHGGRMLLHASSLCLLL